MKRSFALIGAAYAALPAAAGASVLWRGDFSTGDLSQWDRTESVAVDRLRVVRDPEGDGRRVLRTLVRRGDSPIAGATGNRSEVLYTHDRPREGQERYYRWQTLFPDNFNSADFWQIFTQWHQYKAGGSPPLAFLVWGDEVRLGGPGPRWYWTAPLETGRWHDFVVRVVWSTNPGRGGVEIWYDGEHALPFTRGATLFANDTVYVKQGLYRKDLIAHDQVVFHTGMTIGTSMADVAPRTAALPAVAEVAAASTGSDPGGYVFAESAGGCLTGGLAGLRALPLLGGLILGGLRRRRR